MRIPSGNLIPDIGGGGGGGCLSVLALIGIIYFFKMVHDDNKILRHQAPPLHEAAAPIPNSEMGDPEFVKDYNWRVERNAATERKTDKLVKEYLRKHHGMSAEAIKKLSFRINDSLIHVEDSIDGVTTHR